MRRLLAQDGGTLTRILVTLLVFAVLIFAGLYFFTKAQKPLALGNAVDAHLAFSDVLQNHGTAIDPKITLEPNGQVYVATTVHNTGGSTVTLEGLGTVDPDPEVPYVPVDIRLGDGTATETGATTPFTPTPLPSGGMRRRARALRGEPLPELRPVHGPVRRQRHRDRIVPDAFHDVRDRERANALVHEGPRDGRTTHPRGLRRRDRRLSLTRRDALRSSTRRTRRSPRR